MIISSWQTTYTHTHNCIRVEGYYMPQAAAGDYMRRLLIKQSGFHVTTIPSWTRQPTSNRLQTVNRISRRQGSFRSSPKGFAAVSLTMKLKTNGKTTSTADQSKDLAPRYKLVVVGDGNCGKTSLLATYVHQVFPETYVPTIFETHLVNIQVSSNRYNIINKWWQRVLVEARTRLYTCTSLG